MIPNEEGREKKKTKEISFEGINIPIVIEEKAKDANNSSKHTEKHTLDKTGDDEIGISKLSPSYELGN
jgi:hypothetical protein